MEDLNSELNEKENQNEEIQAKYDDLMIHAASLERKIHTLLKYEKVCGEKGQMELIKKNEMSKVFRR